MLTHAQNEHAHSCSVDHASDAMKDCVPEPSGRVLELKEVHPFSEYHDSLEQDHGEIANQVRLAMMATRKSHASAMRTRYSFSCQLHW